MHEKQIRDLLTNITNFSNTSGVVVVTAMESGASLLFSWLHHLTQHSLTGCADELIYAVSAGVREAGACASIGAVRPCLFSLRAQIDLSLTWIYFKDHPREYNTVCSTGNGFMLKEKLLEYLEKHYSGYKSRFGALGTIMKRKEADPYRLLSAHIHSQSNVVVPNVRNLADIIQDKDLASDCARIQSDVSEYLSDIFFSSGIADHRGLPQNIKDQISGRAVTAAQRAEIFRF